MHILPFRSVLLSLLSLLIASAIAVEKPPANAQAGKADAKLAFARQASESLPAPGPGPIITGCFLWNSRADENYRPFFQWEFRLKGGTADVKSLQIRVITLGPVQQVLATGPWKSLGTLVAGGIQECDYRLNCTNPPAFRVEVTWQGGEDKFLAWDRLMVPISLKGLKDQALLACVGGYSECDKKKGLTAVIWSLWNIGGMPVKEGASVTVRFLSEQGDLVHRAVWQQPKNVVIAANSANEQRLLIRKALESPGMSFTTSLPTPATDAGTFGATNVGGVVIAEVIQEDKTLKTRIKNATTGELKGLVVTIALLDQSNRTVITLDFPALDLKVGDEKESSVLMSKTVEWSGYETSWRTTVNSGSPAAQSIPLTEVSAPANGASGGNEEKSQRPPKRLAVKGLEFNDITLKPGKKGMVISGILRNNAGRKLENLTLNFSAQASNDASPVTVSVEELDQGQTMRLEFTAKDMANLSGLDLSWTEKKLGR